MSVHASIEKNNVGCELLTAGDLVQAHQLFRDALHCHMNGNELVMPRSGLVTPDADTGCRVEGGDNNGIMRDSATGIDSAQMLEMNQADMASIQPASSSQNKSRDSMLLRQIHKQAFPIHQTDPSFTHPSAAAIHVFNLGLVHHLMDSASWKAKSFYELAALMLALNPTFSNNNEEDPNNDLRVSLTEAIINNLRICLIESG